MNWNLVLWFAGVCATLAGLKFVIVMFRSLFSKDMMTAALDNVGNKVHEMNDKITKNVKKKAIERKKQKEQEKRAIVIIR